MTRYPSLTATAAYRPHDQPIFFDGFRVARPGPGCAGSWGGVPSVGVAWVVAGDAVTRREKHMTALDLAEEFLMGDSERTKQEIIDAIRFVRGRCEGAPPWWAEVVYELRAERREDREDAA